MTGGYVLGIDAGGTKTVCLLADEQGNIVAESRAGGANLQAAGELQVEKVLHGVMDAALGDRRIVPAAICLGIAGVDREDDRAVVQGILRRIGSTARLLVVNDALLALVASVGNGPGVVVVVGTGSIAYGRNAQGQAARSGGWGHLLGDEGSGYWIGRHALRAVVRAADGRGQPTAITPWVLAHFGVDQPQALIHEVYHGQLKPSDIGALARSVQSAHAHGDEVATAILTEAVAELRAAAAAVVHRLELDGTAFRFVLSGGVFAAVPALETALTAALGDVAPRASVERLTVDPARGAVSLALAEAHGGALIPEYRLP